jgi:hypothetical protein
MTKSCDFCGEVFQDAEALLAVIQTKFRRIASRTSYAMDQPSIGGCERLFHKECFDHILHVAYEAEFGEDGRYDWPDDEHDDDMRRH